MEVTYDFS